MWRRRQSFDAWTLSHYAVRDNLGLPALSLNRPFSRGRLLLGREMHATMYSLEIARYLGDVCQSGVSVFPGS